MATNYSLICWGGRTGRNPTSISNASPCVVTFSANHGLLDGTGVVLTTSGALPTGLTVGTTYYVRVASATTIHLYDTQAHALDTGNTTGRINTSSAGSGTHTVTSDLWYNFDTTWGATFGGVAKTRYGSAGSERVYDGLQAWRTARAAAIVTANQYDTEVAEIGMAWTDIYASSSSLTLDLAVVAIQIETKINGYRTTGFHYGALTGGYTAQVTSAFYVAFDFNRINIRVDGVAVYMPSNDQVAFNLPAGTIPAGSINAEIANCVIKGNTGSYNQTGILHRCEFGAAIHDNIVYQVTSTSGTRAGIYLRANAGKLGYVYNNIVTGCDRGIYADSAVDGGYIFNNISTGNTTNWGTAPTGISAGNNGQASSGGSAWDTGSPSTTVTVATSDFASSTDFTPKLTSSPQVNAGTAIYGGQAFDIYGNERPAYNNGGTETWDLGAFEKNLGYTRPVQRDLVFTGQEDGSQIIIYQTGLTGTSAVELQRNNSTSGDETYSAGVAGVVVDYTIMKLGYDPIHVTGVSLDAETTTITVQQTPNRAWVASSGLTYTTDLTFTAGTPNILKLRIASTLQNALCCLYEAFINSSTNTALRNIDFPILTNGPNSFSLIATEWRGWSTTGTATSNTSLELLSRDGMRYLASNGTTVNATWAAFYTPDTPAGMQVKYKQSSGGSPVSALTTGPIDQLIQIYGASSYGSFDYTGFMEMRAPKVGYSQPKPDFVAIYGTLEDQFYAAGLAPALQYTTTNSDPGGLTFNNTTKTSVVTASRSVLQLYQGAQWWANQDAQWSADIPLVSNSDGTIFTQPATWTLSGLNYLTGTQTISGGTITLAGPATYTMGFASATVQLQGEGEYVITATGSPVLTFAPTANAVTYVMGDGTFGGTVDLRNTHATRTITVELPSGTTYTTANNTGASITVNTPQVYQSVTISGAVAGSRIQIYDLTSSTELYNGTPSSPYTWTDPDPAAATREIRLRVTKVSGTTAKKMIEATIGTCAVSGTGKDVSYIVNQEDDDVYNTNAIDGSAVANITIDDTTNLVKINLAASGNVSNKSIYAYQVYWLNTSTGIQDDFAFIDAPDTANYIYSNFQWKNIGTGIVTIIDGYPRDTTTGLSATLIDTSGGMICVAPDHVVPYSTGSGLTAGEHAQLMSLPESSTIATAVWSKTLP